MTYVETLECCEMEGHELKRNDSEDSLETVDNRRNRKNLVAEAAQVFCEIFFADKNRLALKSRKLRKGEF